MINSQASIVAAFDFDGTLTYRDTMLSFLLFSTGYPALARAFVKQIPTLSRYSLGLVSRQHAKESVLSGLFKGESMDGLREKGKMFGLGPLNSHLKPKMMQRLRWHLNQGHCTVLVSASLDVYLEPWAKQTGFHHVITSQLEVGPNNEFTGCLKGLNCWGPEKTRRLEEVLGTPKNYFLYAYGDSRGDKELLQMADVPIKVS